MSTDRNISAQTLEDVGLSIRPGVVGYSGPSVCVNLQSSSTQITGRFEVHNPYTRVVYRKMMKVMKEMVVMFIVMVVLILIFTMVQLPQDNMMLVV